ncbi:hypothetical protein P3T73_15220 [Kiritimatiellota bacterium B12222]|nr:hypothetical protein P3T73_15220 [Kiritimatiellota bacterium B12222]
MSKKVIIHVPKEGVPRYCPPETPDTKAHRYVRMGLICMSTGLYFIMIFGWIFGFWQIPMTQAGGLGLMVLAVPVVADGLIRPGKGKTWLWTLVSVLVIIIVPFVWILFPVGLIFSLIIQNLRHRKTTP